MSRTEDMAQDRIYKHYDYYIRESIYNDDTQNLKLEIEDNLKTIEGKNSLIRNLKAKEEWHNLNGLAGKLFGDKEFSDLKLVCKEKTLNCHKAVLSCQSEVFKNMIKNKSLIEKPGKVMEIEEIYMNSDSMEQLVFYLYHAKVKDARMINADLLMAADKYMVNGFLSMCVEYLKFNLSLENVLDVLVKAELTNQKSLFDSASRFIRKNSGKLNKSIAYNEMFEKDPKLIARVLSNMLDVE